MKLPRILVVLLLSVVSAMAQEPKHNTLTPEETIAGFRLLFDGTPKLLAFRGVQKSNFLQSGWKIVDGTLSMEKSIQQSGRVTGGDIATVESFVDFEFWFEWKGDVGGNSGVMYFVKSSLGGKTQGNEFQIIDDTHHPEGLKGGPIRRTGGLTGVFPPGKPLGDTALWTKGRIVVQGNHVEHWVNDEKVLEYEVGSPAMQAAVKAAKLPLAFGAKTRSPIVLLDQGEGIAFRNLKIKAAKPPGAK